MRRRKRVLILAMTFAVLFSTVTAERILTQAAELSPSTAGTVSEISNPESVGQTDTAKKSKGGWKEKKGKVYYYNSKGEKITGWKTIDGQRYYFEKSGKKKGQMVTGWQTIGGKKYYFLKSGKVGKKKGRMATGWQTIGSKTYYFEKSGKKKGQMATGWRTIEKKKYYFIPSGKNAGQMATGWQMFGKTCYYFNSKGVLNTKKTVNTSRNGDKTGSAKTKTMRRAQAIVAQITTDKMTKAQKLKVCFDYVMKTYTGRRPRTPHYCGDDWPVVYANDMFLDGSGNCFSYAAAFAFMAKACGYENVYACNSTGHGWAEIDGKIYDPEEYRNTKYKYYGTSYSAVPSYRSAISARRSFMHVKI